MLTKRVPTNPRSRTGGSKGTRKGEGETNLRSTVRSISDSYISFPLLVTFLSFSEKTIQEKILESEINKKVEEKFLESEKNFKGKWIAAEKIFKKKLATTKIFSKKKLGERGNFQRKNLEGCTEIN